MPKATHTLLPRTIFAKRHYEAVAKAMQDARMHIRCNGVEQMECVVNTLADLFAGDSKAFQRDRFMRACEPGANVRARTSNGQALPSNEWGAR